MFQNEFRETIAILVNVLVAIVVVAAISSVFGLKNRIGNAQSNRYLASERLRTREEFHRYDNKVLLADEVCTAFADNIKDDIIIYYGVDTSNDGFLNGSEKYYAWTYSDYLQNRSEFTTVTIAEEGAPKAIKHDETYSAENSSGRIRFVQEIGINSNVRYISKLIYDNNDPVVQEADSTKIMKDRSVSKRSEEITGVLILRTTITGVDKFIHPEV